MQEIQEVIEPTVKLHMSDTHITLDQPTAQALYRLAQQRFDQALTRMNAALDEDKWSSPHERAKEVLWCTQDLRQAAEVIYELTPLADDEVDA